MQDRVFLSHKTANQEIVLLYYDALKAAGFSPWLDDKDMAAGDDLDESIKKAFKDSCAVVFFLTPDFKYERFLKDEILYAKEEKRAKEDRFAIITVVVPETGKTDKPVVPDLLTQYVRVEKQNHLASLSKIIDSLPIRPRRCRWKTEPGDDEIDEALRSVKGQIESPHEGHLMKDRKCRVTGRVEVYSSQALYLFTGDYGRYWPSKRLTPNPHNRWEGEVDLGNEHVDHTIWLAAVDDITAHYVELYRNQSGNSGHKGLIIPKFSNLLHSIHVKLDLPKK